MAIQLIVALITEGLSCFGPKMDQLAHKVRKNLTISKFLSIMVDIYLEVLIVSYYGLLYYSFDSTGEVVSMMTASALFGLSLTLIPALFIYILSRPIETLKENEFAKSWQAFMDPIRINKSALSFRGFFLMRRFLIFIIIFFNRSYVGIQIVLIFYINIVMSLFQGMVRPFN